MRLSTREGFGYFPLRQERGGVVRGDGDGAAGDEVSGVRCIEGEDRLAAGQGRGAESGGLAAGFGVGDEEAARQGGDVGVALGGQRRGGTADGRGEEGEDE